MKLNQRPATEADIPFLFALRRATMDAHLRAAGADTSDRYHRERLMYKFEWANILVLDSESVGLLKVVKEPPIWEIVQIQLVEKLQGRGIGGFLLQQVIAEAATAKCDTRLSVLKSSPAKRLYESLGFVVVGEDEHEYFMHRAAA